ncbi:MAG: phytoene/squalene synthase family protein [Chitinophagaceae bacterium]|nr:phytoene/squalene synthase family protein [Chitinophagaceae bacterium]MCB9045150.1 phytoene/squalene synthase family protein [Chitinophagales bacterium]
MKQLFDNISDTTSRITTKAYSNSFSLGILCLGKRLRQPIYNIYGFVRFADEIVDTFHDYDKEALLREFREDTVKAIERGISINPVLNSFQKVVHDYNIEWELIDCFLNSMEMDLDQSAHNRMSYDEYILGSAEVVGLMCLRVFTEGDETLYQKLKPAAMRLGAALQKVNFLRDIKDDYEALGRTYFPGVNMSNFSMQDKLHIENEIEQDFNVALEGIKQLPDSSRFGVYVAFVYYKQLFLKIRSLPSHSIMQQRIRIPNYAKLALLFTSYFKHSLHLV